MAARTIFFDLKEGNQPATLLDQMFADFANCIVVPCTAPGSNNIMLTPASFIPALTAYGYQNVFSFVAPATPTSPANAKQSSRRRTWIAARFNSARAAFGFIPTWPASATAFLAKSGCMWLHKKICLPPNWGMRAGAFIATIHTRLSEHRVAPYFDALGGLPETPGRRRGHTVLRCWQNVP